MKRNRYIPFGYEFQNGAITISNTEASAVREIYTLYTEGASYKSISVRMGEAGIAYHEGAAWNKHMVKRILENPRYTGAEGYPAILGNELAELVGARKAANPHCRPPKRKEPVQQADDTPATVIAYVPSKEVLRVGNEINRALEKTDIDTAGVKSLIFSCAAEKYNSLIGVIQYG